MIGLLLLACAGAPTSGGGDTGVSNGGDGGVADGGGADGGADGGGEAPRLRGEGDCWVEEGEELPADTVLDETYWALPVYIAGGDRRFETIQDAIWGAEEGDTVVVKPGTYIGVVDLVGKAITLCSEAGAERTILDGDGQGPTVRLRNWEPPQTVVQGFTIRGGSGEGDDVFGPTPHGGGIFVEWGSPTIRHNLVVHNRADIGAGIYLRNGGPTVENNLIAFNDAAQGGGGLACSACVGRIAYNTVAENDAPDGPAAEYFWGAADFRGNILLVPPDARAAIRWHDPRTDIAWDGSHNLLWPDITLLDGGPDSDWPGWDTWLVADPLLSPDPDSVSSGWTLPDGSPAIDAGPPDERDADGSPADLGMGGGAHGRR